MMPFWIGFGFTALLFIVYYYGLGKGMAIVAKAYVKNCFILHSKDEIDKETLFNILPSLKEDEYQTIIRAIKSNLDF